ncbi:MAG: molybdenum cofactor biosysynthesis protein [Opitutaceae bacterium]|nr:molybdenum cofactor biosysynthesis protein [Opitutaceae bacterium]MBP9901500.1 molybdenum cofactor biosysynthesis protein [Verrucomicrobiota bacterium]
MQAIIRQLYISPGHNFFGRHGQPADVNPTQAVDQIMCRAGRGLEGDRFLDYKADYKGQATFFDWSIYERIKMALAVPALSPGAFRRNVLIEGLDLNGLIGRRFRLGGVIFEGTGEAKPCYWMNQAVAPGAEAWLLGNGGLRTKILADGPLEIGAVECALVESALSPAASQ